MKLTMKEKKAITKKRAENKVLAKTKKKIMEHAHPLNSAKEKADLYKRQTEGNINNIIAPPSMSKGEALKQGYQAFHKQPIGEQIWMYCWIGALLFFVLLGMILYF